MQGFDYERAKQELHVPDDYTVEAIVAVGRPGNPEDLPEFQRQREMPSARKTVSEFAFEGPFPDSK